MLHIILLILKIIGVVLLCIVGFLLLSIACVLFVPVRYRIRLMREEGEDKPPVVAYVKVTWLLHLVNILIRYPATVIVRARILLITLFRIPEKAKKSKDDEEQTIKKEKKKKEKQDVNVESESDTGTPQVIEQTAQIDTAEQAITEESEAVQEYTAFGGNEDDFVPKEPEQEEYGESEENKSLFAKIGNIFRKIKQIIEKIKAFFENIQYTIRKFCDKIESVSDNIKYYREVLDSDSFRKAADLCKGELGWALKKLKPDKFEADLIVGMEDPAATGEILAICGMLYPLIGPNVRVVGNFECDKMHIEGRLYMRGKIRVITFLRIVVRIYFNRDIKKLIKLFKKEAV